MAQCSPWDTAYQRLHRSDLTSRNALAVIVRVVTANHDRLDDVAGAVVEGGAAGRGLGADGAVESTIAAFERAPSLVGVAKCVDGAVCTSGAGATEVAVRCAADLGAQNDCLRSFLGVLGRCPA